MSNSSGSPTSVRVNPTSSSDDGDWKEMAMSLDASSAPDNKASCNGEEPTTLYPVDLIRSDILRLSVLLGKLSAAFLQHVPLDDSSHDDGVSEATRRIMASCSELSDYMQELLTGLEAAAARLSLHVPTCILKKMELNRKKYPVNLCKGRAGKYTEYSNQTGITKDQGQSTLYADDELPQLQASLAETLPELKLTIRQFATERTWSKYHLPRNLLMALMGELGELSELFQWSSDEPQSLSDEMLDKVGQEIADVTIYLIRLSDVCGINL